MSKADKSKFDKVVKRIPGQGLKLIKLFRKFLPVKTVMPKSSRDGHSRGKKQ